MKRNLTTSFLKQCSLIVLLIVSITIDSIGQEKTTVSGQERTAIKPISEEDKNTIINLFKPLSIIYSTRLRVEFNRGETYGDRKLSSTEISKIATFRRTNQGENGIIILFSDVASNGVTIYLKDGSIMSATLKNGHRAGNPLLEMLGKAKITVFKTIMEKYIKDPDILDNPEMLNRPYYNEF